MSFEVQIMSKNKYSCLFSRKIGAIVLLSFKYFATSVKNVYGRLSVCCVGCQFSFKCSLV